MKINIDREKFKLYSLIAALLLGLLIVLFPFAWMFSTALKSPGNAFTFNLIPEKLNFDNFKAVLAGENLAKNPEYVPYYREASDTVSFLTEADKPAYLIINNHRYNTPVPLKKSSQGKNVWEESIPLDNGRYQYSFHSFEKLHKLKVWPDRERVRLEAPIKGKTVYVIGNMTGWRPQRLREENGVHYTFMFLDPGDYTYYFTTEVPVIRNLVFRKTGRFLRIEDLGIVPVIKENEIEIFYEPVSDKPVYYVTDKNGWKINPEQKALRYGSNMVRVILPKTSKFYINFFETDDIKTLEGIDLRKNCYNYELVNDRVKIGRNHFWHEFRNVFKNQGNFARYFFNSLIVALLAAFFTTIICSFSGYVFAKKNFYGKEVLFKLLLAGMMVPGMMFMVPQYVLVYVLGTIDFLNIGKILTSLHIMGMNTYGAMFIPHLANVFGLFMIKQYMETIPTSLIEAARIDGASESKIFYRVIMPVASPIVMTLFLLTFIGQWSNFLWQLIMSTSSNMYTLPVGLAMFQGQYSAEWTKLMAASTITVVPIIILFVFAQRYFIEGMTKGAVKG
ncbi:MAG: carbohydrate ABC transporter permease [Candidatus Muiribacteriota bacterium]